MEDIKLDLAAPEITSLLEAFPCYVMLVDEQHRILYANNMVQKELGPEPKEIIGAFCPKAVHGLDERGTPAPSRRP